MFDIDPRTIHSGHDRETERILVTSRGARLGDFGLTRVNKDEKWIVASEWKQTTAPDHHVFRVRGKYGADISGLPAEVRFE